MSTNTDARLAAAGDPGRRPEDHHPERQAARSGPSDHSVHRRRRHRPRHLARQRARARRRGAESLRRQAQDRLDRGLRRARRAFKAFNSWLPDETVQACRDYLVSIKGPLTTPIGGGIRSLNVALRQLLDLYVCLRPVRWFKGVPSPVKAPEKVDMVIFRENTEDIYAGIEFEQGTEDNQQVPRAPQGELPQALRQDPLPRHFGHRHQDRVDRRHRAPVPLGDRVRASPTSARASRSSTRATS